MAGKIADRWDEMLLAGVLRVRGTDDDGNFEYELDLETLKEYDNELYHEHLNEVDESLLNLQSKGLVNLDFTQDDVGVTLTEKGRAWAEAAGLHY